MRNRPRPRLTFNTCPGVPSRVHKRVERRSNAMHRHQRSSADARSGRFKCGQRDACGAMDCLPFPAHTSREDRRIIGGKVMLVP